MDPDAAATAGRPRIPTGDRTVAALFDELAPAYDRLTRVVSFGRDGRWRRAVVAATAVAPGDAVIDVATGTGRLATALAERVGPFGRVVAIDLSPAMVERGAASARDLVQLEFVVGDAMALPSDDGRFDAATIAFGLAGLPDMVAALAELRRVVRPGGRVVCLERAMPTPAWWGRTYRSAVRRLAPLAGRVSGRPEAYRLLSAVRDRVPDAAAIGAAMEAAGLGDVEHRSFWFGSVDLHVGTRPASG